MTATETAIEALPTEAPATTLKPNAITWFELPVTDLARATRFYDTVLNTTLTRAFYGEPMAIFPAADKGITGALVLREKMQPAAAGVMLYLDCTGILDQATARVASAGGKVLVPVSEIGGGFGRFSTILDTEGNHISLHSR